MVAVGAEGVGGGVAVAAFGVTAGLSDAVLAVGVDAVEGVGEGFVGVDLVEEEVTLSSTHRVQTAPSLAV